MLRRPEYRTHAIWATRRLPRHAVRAIGRFRHQYPVRTDIDCPQLQHPACIAIDCLRPLQFILVMPMARRRVRRRRPSTVTRITAQSEHKCRRNRRVILPFRCQELTINIDNTSWEHTAFLQPTLAVARALLGAVLIRELPQGRVVGRIVETEGYLQGDPACHAVRQLPGGEMIQRQTRRNASMFGPPGHAYVYFTYGNHYMLNVVTQPAGVAEAVLIRALEPLEGLEIMAQLRGVTEVRALTSGPGKLCKALGIDRALDGHDLSVAPLRLVAGEEVPEAEVAITPRIGLTRGVGSPWRFCVKGK